MLDAKPYIDRNLGLADLLNWGALINDGTILTKDGALLSGWFYRGADMCVASPSRRNYQTKMVSDALGRLGSGWSVWFESARMPAPSYPPASHCHFPDPVTHAIDEERRAQFNQKKRLFETIQVLLIQYKPPKSSTSKLADFFFYDHKKEDDLTKKHLTFFENTLSEIEGALSSVLTLRRMQSYQYYDKFEIEHLRDELIDYLSFCLNGETHPVNIPPQGAYTDSYMCHHEFYSGLTPKIGDKYIYCIALEGYPAQSHPGMMDILETLPIAYRFSSRFIFMDTQQAIKHIDKLRKEWQQKSRGFFAQIFKTSTKKINEDALHMVQEAHDANTQAESGLLTFGYYTPIIILMDPDREKAFDYAQNITVQLKHFGLRARIETINATSAFFGSLAGHTIPNVRRPFFHTQTLADFLSLSSSWTGQATNPCDFYPKNSPPLFMSATAGSTPFSFNWHVNQLGHGLIFGPTRSGKSTFLAFSVAQFMRYKNAKITAFDKGNSLRVLTHAIGAQYGARHYAIASQEGQISFAPLSHLTTQEEKLWACQWISQCYQLHMQKLPSPCESKEISKAIEQLSHSPKKGRSITDFCSAVQSHTVRQVMEYYTIDKPGGFLLDGQIDGLEETHLKVFELEHLLRLDKRIFLPTMHYIIQRFASSLNGDPAMLVIDEAWIFFKDTFMKKQLEEWLRVLAKANCIVILATQSLYDLHNSGLLPLLIESCPTKIFLPNPEASQPNIAHIYRQFGFTDQEIDMVANAQRQRHYYVSSFDGKRLIELDLGPLSRSFVASTSPDDLKETQGDLYLLWITYRFPNLASIFEMICASQNEEETI